MATYSEHELDDLTEAERTALTEEDNAETTASAATEGDGDAADDTKVQAKTDDGAGADAADDAGTDAGAAGAASDAATGASADEPAAKAQPEKVTIAPVLVAEAPADVEAKLAEIGTKKDELEAKFDEGDLTRAEYRKQMDALNKDERTIEQAQMKAQLAEEMNEQAMLTAWRTTAQNFAKANGYTVNPRLFHMFDLETQAIGQSGKYSDWSEILEAAHANMVEAGLAPGKAGKTDAKADAPAKQVQQKVEHKAQPPNLATVPAAAHSDTSGGKYAALDRLQANDPVAYEEALYKMSESERENYRAA